jgi:AhpD family alkylhydroperoxidase
MLNWLDYRKKLGARIGEFAAMSPDTFKGYQTLSKAGEKTGQLDAKTRELIALAVSVTTRCDGCITVHSAEAVKLGATKAEIAEALGVAVALNAGAAMVYSARALDAVEAHASAAMAMASTVA